SRFASARGLDFPAETAPLFAVSVLARRAAGPAERPSPAAAIARNPRAKPRYAAVGSPRLPGHRAHQAEGGPGAAEIRDGDGVREGLRARLRAGGHGPGAVFLLGGD